MNVPLDRHWSGPLRPDTIEGIHARLKALLEGRRFTVAEFLNVENAGADPRIQVRAGCKLEPNWTDGSTEGVRLWMEAKATDGRPLAPHLGFSADGFYYSFWSNPAREGKREGYPDYGVTHFAFRRDHVEIRDRAPSGNLNVLVFAVEPQPEDDQA